MFKAPQRNTTPSLAGRGLARLSTLRGRAAPFALGAGLLVMGCAPVPAQQADATLAGPVVATDAAHASYQRVLTAAQDLMETLSPAQRDALALDYSFANATRWHTYPDATLGSRRNRLGLQLEGLSEDQWGAVYALLDAALGSAPDEGADEVRQHLSIDDYLRRGGARSDYGRGEFKLAFLGEPSPTGLWELQFGGHHLAVANTYRDGLLIGATPSFRGMEPLTPVEYDGGNFAPQLQEHQAFVALLASLDDTQREQARLSRRGNLMMAGRNWDFPERSQGLAVAGLDREQRALLFAAMETFVGDADDVSAAAFMEKYRREIERTYIGFSGSPSLSATGDYVRIDGPSVWIEFYMDPPFSTEQPHPHALWRDKQADYGGTRP
ncbi:DUF3500 domain-containing protein [uncultured Martelella sp.]|uniref:DUF3500 domain-containing protein n=1 Tax=uncultured Martelella sp. TaxID=392331 RepID=UPI0029C83325|nr:DUF3500 domain-containing protein [uncultured Martelella sp.]